MAPKSNKLKPADTSTPNTGKVKKSKRTRGSDKSKRMTGSFITDPRFIRSIGFLLLVAGIYVFLAIITFILNWFEADADTSALYHGVDEYVDHTQSVESWTGRIGTVISQLLVYSGIGIGSLLLPVISISLGLRMLLNVRVFNIWRWFELIIISFIWLPVTLSLIFSEHPENILGGLAGFQIRLWMLGYLGKAGIILSIILIPVIFLLIDFQFRFGWSTKKKVSNSETQPDKNANRKSPSEEIYNTVEFAVDDEEDESFSDSAAQKGNYKIEEEESVKKNSINQEGSSKPEDEPDIELTVEETPEEKLAASNGEKYEHKGIDTEFDPKLELIDFKLPTLNLLNDYDQSNILVTKEELEINKDRIVDTLKQYQITIVKIKATIGPTVTLYEVVPAPGIRIAKIKNLEDDIALSLSAIGIRIIAPIPGKGTVGIEVPNQNPNIVSLKSVLSSAKFQNTKFDLPFGIGKTISNESYIADLAKMPHLLMAGATGQGKSVGLNAVIASLLYKKHPAELKFILVDPKKVELNLYSRIERHYLAKLPDSHIEFP